MILFKKKDGYLVIETGQPYKTLLILG